MGGKLDSRTRSGYLAVQFDRLAEGKDTRCVSLVTDVARFVLRRHDNVVICVCELSQPSPAAEEGLRRRGAVDGTFMISPKLAPKDFGMWLDRVLLDDLGADPETGVEVFDLQEAAIQV